MEEPEVNLDLALKHGLSEEEYKRVIEILGRVPNYTELGIFSVMWSEHCSYKSSIAVLKTLPREGDCLLTKAGEENAGAVDIFIGGLSGETVVIDLPEPVQTVETNWRGVSRTVTRNKLILAKTLHLRYLIPGEKAARWRARPRLVRREWVMR